MKKHLYVIPTNRLCVSSQESLFNEKKLCELLDDEIAFAVIDSSSEQDAQHNKEKLISLSLKTKLHNIYYINATEFDSEINRNIGNLLDEKALKDCILGTEFSYGKAANRSFLVAGILKADYLHRRDSDVYLQKIKEKWLLPLEQEIKYLGKTVESIEDLLAVRYKNKKTYMVGSGYIGDWGIDYKCLKTDEENLLKMFSLSKPNFSQDEIRTYIKEKYVDGSNEICIANNVLVLPHSAFYIEKSITLLPQQQLKLTYTSLNSGNGTLCTVCSSVDLY